MKAFYSNAGLLSSLDCNGEKPELFIVCSRVRGPGKTYSFCKTLMERYEEDGGKFVLLCRYGAELGDVADGMFKSMLADHYPGGHMVEKIKGGRTFSEVWLETPEDLEEDDISDSPVKRQHVGYVVPLNSANKIKKLSSKFTDAVHGYFDEFQPEFAGGYIPNEVEHFMSVHTSIARGGGKSRRYFPIYMSSNAISIANPYFSALGLTTKIQSDTKKFRGDGFVYQRSENAGLAELHDTSPMSRAFSGLRGASFSDNSWVNDTGAGVCRPSEEWGPSLYRGTIQSGKERFGVLYYPEVQIIYLGHRVDNTYPITLRIDVEGEPNMPLLKKTYIGRMIRDAIEQGGMRYQSETAKQVALNFIA